MRKILILYFLFIVVKLSATTYYVSTTGTDGAYPTRGTFANPFLTIQYGINQLRLGDSLIIRGGTYYPTSGVDCMVYSGTALDPIVIEGYQADHNEGNYVIIDFSNVIGQGFGVQDADYWTIKNITVCHTQQSGLTSSGIRGIQAIRAYGVRFINCVAHHNMGAGFEISGAGALAYFINCDSYSNNDSLSTGDPGNDADGFGNNGYFTYVGGELTMSLVDTLLWPRAYYYNCRTWGNSDDGFGHAYGTYAYHENCYAIHCGYKANGDESMGGRGFTAGHQYCSPPDNQYTFINCLSAYNRTEGFRVNCSGEIYTSEMTFYNNSSFFDPAGFRGNVDNGLLSHPVLYRNNLAYPCSNPQIGWWPTYNYSFAIPDRFYPTYDHNSWDIPIVLTATDFLSLDTAGYRDARQSDGSFPNNDFYNKFGRLSSTSQATGVGINVGRVYDSDSTLYKNPPSIGYDEYEAQSPPVDAILASLSSYKPFWITQTTAQSGGMVSDSGGATVTLRGICWSTSGTPTTADDTTQNGSGTGAFIAIMTGLSRDSIYYVRAYAVNSAGTSYGSIMTFRTLHLFKNNKLLVSQSGKPLVVGGGIPQTEEDEPPDYNWTDNPYFYLPPISDNEGIPLIVGKADTIFGSNIANIPLETEDIWDVTYTCDIGTQVGDNYVINPIAGNVGLHMLKVDFKVGTYIYATQTTHLNVYTKINTGADTLLNWGDSNMNNYFDEEARAIKAVFDGMTFQMVGHADNHADESVWHSAISGSGFHYFATFETSPFVYNGVIDLPYYFANHELPTANKTPRIVHIRDEANNMLAYLTSPMSEAYLDQVFGWMKSLVDAFLAYDPDIIVVIDIGARCTLVEADWDAAYPEWAGYSWRYLENMQRFTERLIQEYRNPFYDTRVYVAFGGFHINRTNVPANVHTDRNGNYQMGLGFANTYNKILHDLE